VTKALKHNCFNAFWTTRDKHDLKGLFGRLLLESEGSSIPYDEEAELAERQIFLAEATIARLAQASRSRIRATVSS
jgi:hypothetical protein